MLCHGIALRTTGVMAVLNQTHGNACGFRTHFCAIAIHVVEQPPFLINVSFGGHKRATVAEYVEMPDTAAVVFTEAVHPAKDTGLDKIHCGIRPKCSGQKPVRCSSGTVLAVMRVDMCESLIGEWAVSVCVVMELLRNRKASR